MSNGVSFLGHIRALLVEKDKRDEQRFKAMETAILKAETAVEKRFESVNEFRQTLSDQTNSFVSRVEFNALKERLDRGEGRSGGIKDFYGWLVAAAMLAFVAAKYFIP